MKPRVARARAHARLLLQNRIGEPELALLRHLVDPERAAIDVGASVGVYTSALLGLADRVVAFEPVPALFRDLVRTFPDALVLPMGVSDQAGLASLHIPRRDGTELHPRASLRPDVDPELDHDQIDVPTCRLDALDFGPVGFIKIDVEGHEVAAVEGAKGLFERDQPVLLVESEIRHGDGPKTVGSVMGDLGYQGWFVHHDRLHPLQDFRDDMQWEPQVQMGSRGRRVNQLRWIVDPSSALPRRLVNNFIFLPNDDETGCLQRLRHAVSG
ncbi:MAG: FkbM family methyltransferase [Acidimicrobiales bacterium]